MIRKVIKFPDSILTQKSLPINQIDEEIKDLARDMIETMRAESGIGISAVQVGVLKRIMIVSVNKNPFTEDLSPEIMINPKILTKNGLQSHSEGCLSFPGIFIPVNRYDYLEVEYQDIWGITVKAILYGIESVCFQHELDHLNGIVFINKDNSNSFISKNYKNT